MGLLVAVFGAMQVLVHRDLTALQDAREQLRTSARGHEPRRTPTRRAVETSPSRTPERTRRSAALPRPAPEPVSPAPKPASHPRAPQRPLSSARSSPKPTKPAREPVTRPGTERSPRRASGDEPARPVDPQGPSLRNAGAKIRKQPLPLGPGAPKPMLPILPTEVVRETGGPHVDSSPSRQGRGDGRWEGAEPVPPVRIVSSNVQVHAVRKIRSKPTTTSGGITTWRELVGHRVVARVRVQ